MKPVLEIHNIGKKYRITHQSGGYLSLRERMTSAMRLRKTEYEDFWAVKDVSFQVEPGESIGIIGRNGAGKSTLLKILSKITPPTKGRIVTRGRMASLLEVGTGFHPELTGRENIFFNGSLLGMRRREIQAKFDEIVDFSGTEKFLDTPLKHYSSGMQLRLAFSVAAFLEPEILVIDEVLAVGDAEFQKKCLGKMEDVSKSGRTILFVSHNLGAVKNLCSRCMLLSSGEINYNGSVESTISQYLAGDNQDEEDKQFKRPHGAPLWIERVLLNGKSKNIIIEYGEEINIEVLCNSERSIRPYIGFILISSDGIPILCANNRYQRNKAAFTSNNLFKINCNLGNVPLLQGTYSLSFYLGDEEKDHHVIENSIQIQVSERDIWGDGKTPPKVSYLYWNTIFDIDLLQ